MKRARSHLVHRQKNRKGRKMPLKQRKMPFNACQGIALNPFKSELFEMNLRIKFKLSSEIGKHQ